MVKCPEMATITIDTIANELFITDKDKRKGYLSILETVQNNLLNKGEVPKYRRVIFAVDGQDRFVEISDNDMHLDGVFPMVLGVFYKYGFENQGLRNFLSIDRYTLVVANNESIANFWESELRKLEYSIRKI
jgi:hypothetical protein